MKPELVKYNTELVGTKVLPELRGLFEDEWEDKWWPKPLSPDERYQPAEAAKPGPRAKPRKATKSRKAAKTTRRAKSEREAK